MDVHDKNQSLDPADGGESGGERHGRRRRRRGGQRHRRRREAREARERSTSQTAAVTDESAPTGDEIEPHTEVDDASSPVVDETHAGALYPVPETAADFAAEARSEADFFEPPATDDKSAAAPRRSSAAESRRREGRRDQRRRTRLRNRDNEIEGRVAGDRGGRRRRGGDDDAEDAEDIIIEVEPTVDETDAALDEEPLDDEAAVPAAVEVLCSDDPRERATRGRHDMLINVADPDECRIAILADDRLEELYMERAASASHVGNIYKGRVTNVEPSIQAAFIDFGLPVHGFLHISDVQPQYFPDNREGEQVGRKTPRRDRPPIQRCLRRGQEVIVQITKEGIGTKGPTMTTYVSVPGRFLVMMPGMAQLGVSRKIEDEDERRKARTILNQLKVPRDRGIILRTAGVGRPRRDLQRDLNYLNRLWNVVQKRIDTQRAPCELYQESDLVIRTIRDVYSSDVGRIIADDESTARKVAEFLGIANPRGADCVIHYTGKEPLFHLYGIESEIEKLHSRHVDLPCGGSLVIDPTEALVAIDVNSGRFRVQNDAEETARRVNLEAADEIARQLRLRDLGGVIICDFIDMRLEKHRREVERRLRDALKSHKERAKILRMSRFGIVEMTRQRQRPSISRSVYQDCPHCRGSGLVKTVDSMTLDVQRVIQMAAHRQGVNLIDVRVSQQVATQLLNRKRRVLAQLEMDTGKSITITAIPTYGPDQVAYSFLDRRGREIPLNLVAPAPLPPAGVRPHPRPETGAIRPSIAPGAAAPPHVAQPPAAVPRGTGLQPVNPAPQPARPAAAAPAPTRDADRDAFASGLGFDPNVPPPSPPPPNWGAGPPGRPTPVVRPEFRSQSTTSADRGFADGIDFLEAPTAPGAPPPPTAETPPEAAEHAAAAGRRAGTRKKAATGTTSRRKKAAASAQTTEPKKKRASTRKKKAEGDAS